MPKIGYASVQNLVDIMTSLNFVEYPTESSAYSLVSSALSAKLDQVSHIFRPL